MYDYLIVGAGLFGATVARTLPEKEKNVVFGGRLGEYKHYDMDQVIMAALEKSRELMERRRATAGEESW